MMRDRVRWLICKPSELYAGISTDDMRERWLPLYFLCKPRLTHWERCSSILMHRQKNLLVAVDVHQKFARHVTNETKRCRARPRIFCVERKRKHLDHACGVYLETLTKRKLTECVTAMLSIWTILIYHYAPSRSVMYRDKRNCCWICASYEFHYHGPCQRSK